MNQIKLTQYSRSSGCGCKISPEHLQKILTSNHLQPTFNNLIVGYNTADDAAVMDIGNNECVVSTTDFFMPIVDDPYTFGKIAAANAISDIYAMGALPIMALGILGFPIGKLETTIAKEIIEGARETCKLANIPLAGGHSIDNLEPFFGLAVTGTAKRANIKTNAGAKPNDVLFLTKPIGTGILASAFKRNVISQNHYNLLINTASQLNSIGTFLGTLNYVNAVTDVTGFGLLGHCTEMAIASNLCANINMNNVPVLDGVDLYLEKYIYPDNTTKNYNAYKATTLGMNGLEFLKLCDPQTNGGLLISVSKNNVEEFLEIFSNSKMQPTNLYEIGCMNEFDNTKNCFVELV